MTPDDIRDLLTREACTASCLFALGDESKKCGCRCRGENHGHGMDLIIGRERDPLIGMYAITFRDCPRCGTKLSHQHVRIKRRIPGTAYYLVKQRGGDSMVASVSDMAQTEWAMMRHVEDYDTCSEESMAEHRLHYEFCKPSEGHDE